MTPPYTRPQPGPRPLHLARPSGAGSDDPRALGVLYENDAWLGGLFQRLEQRGVPYVARRMDDAAVWFDEPPAAPLVFNKVSPSSYLRGHGPAIPFARAVLDLLDAHGCRVVNGATAFRCETSKVAQLLLLQRLGLEAPRTLLFNRPEEVLAAAAAGDLRFPAILKPDCGGSGALVRAVQDRDHLAELLEDGEQLFGPDHVLLLQERMQAPDGDLVRTELVDGELVYAMKVRATNTFNLCPAEGCERHSAGGPEEPRVEFEPYPDISPSAVAQTREILRAAQLDVGGVEYIEDADGHRWFIDVNATSVYRTDVGRAFGVDGLDVLASFLERELHKELAKRADRGGGWARGVAAGGPA